MIVGGNIVSIKDNQGQEITSPTHIGNINPYLYRGYRLDRETNLYYLNSRYYNAQWGRFLNGDNYGGTIGELLSHNVYAYCLNNPINMSDESGYFAIPLIPIAGEGVKIGIGFIFAILINESAKNATTTIPKSTQDKIARGLTGILVGTSAKAEPKAITMDKVDAIPKVPPKPTQYWSATSNANKILPLSYPKAIATVKIGGNIICIDKARAFAVAKWFPGSYLEGPHGGEGYYSHYHISSKHGPPHIWFYETP